MFNPPGEFPVPTIWLVLHGPRNPQSSVFVKLFGGKEFGVPGEKLVLVEGDVTRWDGSGSG